MRTPADIGEGVKGPCERPQLLLLYYSIMFCGRSVWVMPKYKL